MGALCNHSLELTGLAGDPGSPVHRLDPRAKIVGLVAVWMRRIISPDAPAARGAAGASSVAGRDGFSISP